MENQTYRSAEEQPRRKVQQRTPPKKARKRKRPFALRYLLLVCVLLVLFVLSIAYVHSTLVNYENNQPENILAGEIDRLRAADKKGKFEKVLSLDAIRQELGASEAEVEQFKSEFLASKITFKEDHSSVDASHKTFDVLSDGCKVAAFTLDHVSQTTKLLIFTLDKWKVADFQVTGYEVDLTAPASVIVKSRGEVVEGTPGEKEGTFTYAIRSLVKPEVTICDILGNSVPYDKNDLPTFTDYKVVVPSNYTIQGKEAVPVSAATLEADSTLKSVKEYCPEIPDTATYIISIMSETPDFQILDNYGDPVEFQMENRKVTLKGQAGKDTLPMNVDIDPMNVAKMWSNFMTQDLAGATNGYGTMAQYLIDGSYLQDVAKKWATGPDITFSSKHTLENPPFHTEKIGNFVVYSDNCFSCDVRLEKTMHLTRTGATVENVLNDTFYFVKHNGSWKLALNREIIEEAGR